MYDPKTDDRELMAQEICASTNSSFVSPFDDPLIIAGQGTVGLEIARQSEHMGIKPDLVLVPAGGGGLAAGCAIAIKELIGCEIMSVEPDAFDDTKRSLETGVRQSVAPGGKTICDSLLPPMPGEITFSVNKRLLSGGVSVSDEEVLSAIKLAMLSFKVVAEPGGVVAVAAAVNGKYDAAGKTVVAIVSGGNIDPEMLSRALET